MPKLGDFALFKTDRCNLMTTFSEIVDLKEHNYH